MQAQHLLKILIVSIVLTSLLSGCSKEKLVFKLPNNYQVEGYWEATGFTDAGAVFEVFKINQGLFSSKKRIGYAVDWSRDLISLRPDSFEIVGNSLIVKHRLGIDSILIQNNKYCHC
jgi:hypothetical protein